MEVEGFKVYMEKSIFHITNTCKEQGQATFLPEYGQLSMALWDN